MKMFITENDLRVYDDRWYLSRPKLQTAVCEWLRFHGLDPNRIPIGSYIIRDEATFRIYYQTFKEDKNGRIVHDDGIPVLLDCVEQGEAPPLPFSDVILSYQKTAHEPDFINTAQFSPLTQNNMVTQNKISIRNNPDSPI